MAQERHAVPGQRLTEACCTAGLGEAIGPHRSPGGEVRGWVTRSGCGWRGQGRPAGAARWASTWRAASRAEAMQAGIPTPS
jgi:hypothetical protein